jgi:hypothetical protein
MCAPRRAGAAVDTLPDDLYELAARSFTRFRQAAKA